MDTQFVRSGAVSFLVLFMSLSHGHPFSPSFICFTICFRHQHVIVFPSPMLFFFLPSLPIKDYRADSRENGSELIVGKKKEEKHVTKLEYVCQGLLRNMPNRNTPCRDRVTRKGRRLPMVAKHWSKEEKPLINKKIDFQGEKCLLLLNEISSRDVTMFLQQPEYMYVHVYLVVSHTQTCTGRRKGRLMRV